uniref:Uncharacterized protein n=1 Tax=Oryza rufipogon TaxID=4529 RepID=A0A0E0QFN3_ORYRU
MSSKDLSSRKRKPRKNNKKNLPPEPSTPQRTTNEATIMQESPGMVTRRYNQAMGHNVLALTDLNISLNVIISTNDAKPDAYNSQLRSVRECEFKKDV